ncbi:hypothetical protein WMY93_028422 [Mugilogobius chulae]|uniref:Uncharacterized protein n=1 Tax=Mugilogobius chulae TaxID=88201 RepID=A0AAW0MND9_9GOBI
MTSTSPWSSCSLTRLSGPVRGAFVPAEPPPHSSILLVQSRAQGQQHLSRTDAGLFLACNDLPHDPNVRLSTFASRSHKGSLAASSWANEQIRRQYGVSAGGRAGCVDPRRSLSIHLGNFQLFNGWQES